MTWEETILYIRTQPSYTKLVEQAYFESELQLNVERFRKSEEFLETLAIIKKYTITGKRILDIGSGNGISPVAFALEGYEVVCIEPDGSNTIGAGAIRWLKSYYNLTNLEVYECFAEDINFESEIFDVVYARQCMHHAHHLGKFVGEMARVLKKDGLFLTVRDHVVFNKADKEWFLESHPLQKFYGGENAFSANEYRTAINKSGLHLLKELKYYDSVINYFPTATNQVVNFKQIKTKNLQSGLRKKIGFFAKIPLVFNLYMISKRHLLVLDELLVPGRMYSYLAKKI